MDSIRFKLEICFVISFIPSDASQLGLS